MKTYEILIIGAGPAGLTAAWEANKHGLKTLILEGDKEVGGISRTVERNGWRFDIGGHRFFTKVEEVYEIWDEMYDTMEDFDEREKHSLNLIPIIFNIGKDKYCDIVKHNYDTLIRNSKSSLEKLRNMFYD